MSTLATVSKRHEVIYPESDGLPLSDNTKQFRWIMTIQGGLDAMYLDEPNVLVVGNLLWYPIEGDNKTCTAPDIFVVFGRPKGDRGSYRQWEEGNIAPQVTFEIVSPSNRAGMLTEKFNFFDRFGVDEYYLYDPDDNSLDGWIRKNERLNHIDNMNGWVSPLLGIRFELVDGDLRIYSPKGELFVATAQAIKQRNEAMKASEKSEQAAAQAQQMVKKLMAQLKSLGVKPEE